MAEKFKNLVSATLASSITATSTTLELKAGDGAQLPVIANGAANTFRIAITNKTGATEIIMICRRESGSDTLYVGTGTAHQAAGNVLGRAQESTSALAITYTDDHIIEMPLTAAQIEAATEYSTLGGLTSSVAELNILDGVTVTAANINSAGTLCKDVTATATELNLLDADNRTVGDIITETAAGTMGAIAAVAATQYLKSAGVATLPAYGKLALSDTGVKIGEITADTAGAVVVTGVGFNPSVVIFLAQDKYSTSSRGLSIGFDDGTTRCCVEVCSDVSYGGYTANYSIAILHRAGYMAAGYVSAKSSDGFTVTFSAPSGTYENIDAVYYLALP